MLTASAPRPSRRIPECESVRTRPPARIRPRRRPDKECRCEPSHPSSRRPRRCSPRDGTDRRSSARPEMRAQLACPRRRESRSEPSPPDRRSSPRSAPGCCPPDRCGPSHRRRNRQREGPPVPRTKGKGDKRRPHRRKPSRRSTHARRGHRARSRRTCARPRLPTSPCGSCAPHRPRRLDRHRARQTHPANPLSPGRRR